MRGDRTEKGGKDECWDSHSQDYNPGQMKPIIAGLLLLLTPMAALAQHQQHSTAKKLEWIGIGALAGGVGATVAGVTRKREVPTATFMPNTSCAAFPAMTCVPVVTGTTTVIMPAGTMQVGTGTGSFVLSTQQHRATNWKLAGPAIGAAGAGALMLELGHLQVKRAELSIRPDGVIRVAIKW
jgi:hypothetical protein